MTENEQSHLTKLMQVVSLWKDVQLDSQRAEWDNQGLEIDKQQERSAEARKRLTDVTRDFKKLPDEKRLTSVGSLLKSYQEEIDCLTRRAKYAEAAFLSVYRLFYEVPDPVPALVLAMDDTSKVAAIEAEAHRLQTELQHVTAELSTLRNQDMQVRQLETRIRDMDSNMEEHIRTEVERRVAEAKDVFGRSEGTMRDRERQLTSQLESTENSLVTLQRAFDRAQAQLQDARSRSRPTEDTSVEASLLTRDLAAATERIAALEAERDLLRLKLSPQKDADTDARRVLDEKDATIAALMDKLSGLEATWVAERERMQAAVDTAQRDLAEREARVGSMTEQMRALPSPVEVDALRQQLKVLKTLQFNLSGEEDDEPDGGPNSKLERLSGDEAASVVALLAQKNRRLEDDVARLRRALEEKTSVSDGQTKHIGELQAQLATQAALVATLEGAASMLGPSPTPSLLRFSESAADIPDFAENAGGPLTPEPVSRHNTKPADDALSMMEIVCGQRDRFKARITELESQIMQMQQEKRTGNLQVESLKADNLSLYNKIRFLESYRPGVGAAPVAAGSGEIAVAVPSDAERRYEREYETQMDPFSRFKRQEQSQRVKQLNVAERAALVGGRMLFANRIGRNAFFFYAIALHMMVFMALYRLAHCMSS